MHARGWASRFAKASAAGALLIASAANADTLRATYGVSLFGLPIGVASVEAILTPSSYAIDARGRLSGVATLFSNSRGASTGAGAIIGGHIMPSTFATVASNANMTRTVRMALVGNAVKGVDITPPFVDRPDRVPLTAKDERGVVDPVGAFVLTAPAGADATSPASCNRTIPVFDGYTRFDISLAYVGQRAVKTKGYAGPVVVCSVRYTPIAGHRPDRPATRFMAENKDMEVWLAPVGRVGILMPYRIAVQTMVGLAVVEATEFSVRK